MGRWMERYQRGDRVQVWTDMTGLGADLRDTGDWADAEEVARETMRRVRHNVERLVELLPRNGYRLDDPSGALVPPVPGVHEQLDRLEGKAGSLPLALRCWYTEVGQVNLVGHHPDWDYKLTDPLVIDATVEFLLSEHEEWAAEQGTEWDSGSFTLDLAPDYLHKADISGGPAYAMAVPNPGADGLFLWERHQTTFVNYLRVCFRWGGFPGWDRGALDGWARPEGPPPAMLAELAESLLPI